MKINKHNLKLYSNEDLIELCRLYHHSKDIPRWLYQAIRHRNIQEIAMCHMTSLNPKRTLDEVRKEAENMNTELIFRRIRIGLINGHVNIESLMKSVRR